VPSSRRGRAARSLVVGGDQGQMVPKARMVADVQITANQSPRPATPLAAPPWPEIGPRTLTGRNRPYPLAPVSTKSTRFAPDSPLEGDGFELLVPRHKSLGFPQHSGHGGGSTGSLKRHHLILQPFFFCARG